MSYLKSPKAEFSIDPTKEEYIKASLLVERQGGYLNSIPIVVIISAVLLFIGLSSMNWFRSTYYSVFIPLILCFCCPLLLVIFFYIQPAILKKRAEKYYRTYQEIMKTANLKFFVDDVITESEYLTLTDPYALMSLCIETPDLFVLAKDRERMLVIPKRCIPQEKRQDFTSFLRQVFARRRKVMKNWIF
jgi:hypothetical protein